MVRACLESHSMLVAEPGPTPRIDVHLSPAPLQVSSQAQVYLFICPSPASASPLLPLMEASLSFPVGAREDMRVSGSELGEVF